MDWLRQLPMGHYVDGNRGWIRRVDVRLKLGWTLAFLVTPILANGAWRLGLVGLLLLLTAFCGLPLLLWRRMIPLLLAASCCVGAVFLVIPTGAIVHQTPQRPTEEVRLLPVEAPRSAAGEPWQLRQWGPVGQPPLQLGPLAVNRASLDLALRSGTLLFTLVHSANLLLISTPAEDLAWAFAWILHPLQRLGIPTTELGFMLLLALRFLPLVQEELQNLLRALATRSFQLRQLGFKGGTALLLGTRRAITGQPAAALRAGGGSAHGPGRSTVASLGAATENTNGEPAQWLCSCAACAVCGTTLAGWLVLGVLAWPPSTVRIGRSVCEITPSVAAERYLNHPTFGLLYRVCPTGDSRDLYVSLYAQRMFFLVTMQNQDILFQTIPLMDARALAEQNLNRFRRTDPDAALAWQDIFEKTFI